MLDDILEKQQAARNFASEWMAQAVKDKTNNIRLLGVELDGYTVRVYCFIFTSDMHVKAMVGWKLRKTLLEWIPAALELKVHYI